MNFINTATNEYPVSFAALRDAYPLTLFPEDFSGAFGDYAPVFTADAPAYNAATEKIVETAPQLQNGQWTQTWEVVPLTEQEIEASRIAALPTSCTPAQGLVALYTLKGITETDVLDAIAGIEDDTQRYIARVAYDKATMWERSSASMQTLAALLGLTEADLDALFTAAAGVQV